MTNKILILLLLTVSTLCDTSQKYYKKLKYEEVVQRIEAAVIEYPESIQMFDAMEKYSKYLSKNTCSEDKVCKHYVLKITNWKSPIEEINKRPQMLLVGSMHGNEVVGTNVLTYLTEVIGKQRNREDIWDMLNSLMIVMIPMANPQGFFKVVRVSFFG